MSWRNAGFVAIRPARQLDADRVGTAADVDQLSVDPHAQQHTAILPDTEPELVPVPASGEGSLSGRLDEGRTDVCVDRPCLAQPAWRKDLATAACRGGHRATVQDELPEPEEVEGGRAEPAVVNGGAGVVGHDLRVAGSAHRRPDEPPDQLCHTGARRPLAHPAQDIRLRRAVEEVTAVRTLGTERAQVGIQPALVKDPLVHLPDVGTRILVVLKEASAASHVQQVPYRGAGIPGCAQLGDILLDGLVLVEHAAVEEDSGHAADEGLGHREDGVDLVWSATRDVPLGRELASLEHCKCVGEGVLEHRPKRARRAVDPLDSHGVDVESLGPIGECQDRTRSPGDDLSGTDLTDVPHRPPVVRRVQPVRCRHLFIAGRGCRVAHP